MFHNTKNCWRQISYLIIAICSGGAFFIVSFYVQTRDEPTVTTVEKQLLSYAKISGLVSPSQDVLDLDKDEDIVFLDIDSQDARLVQDFVEKMNTGTGKVLYAKAYDSNQQQVFLAMWYDVSVSGYSVPEGSAGSIIGKPPSRQGALRVWLIDQENGKWVLRNAYADPAFESDTDGEYAQSATYLVPRLFNVTNENEKKLMLRYRL